MFAAAFGLPPAAAQPQTGSGITPGLPALRMPSAPELHASSSSAAVLPLMRAVGAGAVATHQPAAAAAAGLGLGVVSKPMKKKSYYSKPKQMLELEREVCVCLWQCMTPVG